MPPRVRVKVVARVRPLASGHQQEEAAVVCTENGLQVATSIAEQQKSTSNRGGLSTSRVDAKSYSFDASAGPEITQSHFSDDVVNLQELVTAALDGYAVTIFAFGQTGAGKTHTLAGPPGSLNAYNGGKDGDGFKLRDDAGLVPRALCSVFDSVKSRAFQSVEARVSICEIYSEQVTDLLEEHRPSVLTVRHSPHRGFYVDGLSQHRCDSVGDALEIFGRGFLSRRLGSHKLNAASNRSHCIMTLHLDSVAEHDDASGGEGIRTGATRHGKMVFVDLAGSERLKQSGSSGVAAKETGFINRSLFVLGKVISSLGGAKKSVRSANFVPYRESKLTQLLIDGLHGRGRSVMIACCAPEEKYAEDTMNTLRFARLASNITAEPVVILDPQEQVIQDLRTTISTLKEENLKLVHKLDTLLQGKAHGIGLEGSGGLGHAADSGQSHNGKKHGASTAASPPLTGGMHESWSVTNGELGGEKGAKVWESALSLSPGGSSNGSSSDPRAMRVSNSGSEVSAESSASDAFNIPSPTDMSSESSMFPELAALEAEFQKNLAIARGEFCEMDRTTEDSESMKSEGRDTPAADDSPLSIVPPLNEVGGAPKSPKLAKPDPLATRWAEKNKWFGTDMEMTQAAYDAHDELIAKGMDSSSKQYYRELSDAVKRSFPGKARLVWNGLKPSRKEEERLSKELRAMNPKYTKLLPRWTPSSSASGSSALYKSYDGSSMWNIGNGTTSAASKPSVGTHGSISGHASGRYGNDKAPSPLGSFMSTTSTPSVQELNGASKTRSSSSLSVSTLYSTAGSATGRARVGVGDGRVQHTSTWDSSTSAGMPGIVINNARKRNSFDVHRRPGYEMAGSPGTADHLPAIVLDRESFVERRDRIMAELQDARRSAEEEHRRILDKLTSFT